MPFLHHTGLTVADLERSLRFWRDAMGMEVLFQQEKDRGYLEAIVGEPGAHVRMAHLAFGGEGPRIPLVPLLPIRMRRTEILTVVYRTGRDAAEALVPRPLQLASDLCVLHVYHMHDAEWFGNYRESAWQLPVLLPDGTPAVYSPFLVLESAAPVA